MSHCGTWTLGKQFDKILECCPHVDMTLIANVISFQPRSFRRLTKLLVSTHQISTCTNGQLFFHTFCYNIAGRSIQQLCNLDIYACTDIIYLAKSSLHCLFENNLTDIGSISNHRPFLSYFRIPCMCIHDT